MNGLSKDKGGQKMKRFNKIAISLLLVSTLIISFSSIVLASDGLISNEEPTEEEGIQNAEEVIDFMEEELATEQTSIVAELTEQKAEYQSDMELAPTEEEKQQIRVLINETADMIAEYEQYEEGIQTYGKNHLIYSPAVASITAYFHVKGYKLAAELLMYAKANNKLNVNYKPRNGAIVKKSPVFTYIAKLQKTKGSNSFPNTGNVYQKDCYYAIHAFNYTKPSAKSRTVTIKDRYDFKYGDYSGIAGATVNTMYIAQKVGVIVPFYTVITQTT